LLIKGLLMMMDMPAQAISKLTQAGKFGQQRRFEFIGGRRLRVSERSGRKSRSYVIDIVAIDPHGRTSVHVPWNWLGLVIAGITAALIGWLVLQPGGAALSLVLLVSGLASVAGLIMMVRGISKRRVFVSCHARVPLLELVLDQPDRTRFNNFVAHLEQRIADAHQQSKLDEGQHVAGELRMLRRLTEVGVFEPDIYQRAKSRLLEKF
jgi:hypothetical protein